MNSIFFVILLFILLQALGHAYVLLFNQIAFLRYTLWLGVFIHEFSHFLACRLTLAPVYEFRAGLSQGYVKHGKSKIPIIGNMLISLAPLFGGVILLVLLFMWVLGLDWNAFKGLLGGKTQYFWGIRAHWDQVWRYFLSIDFGSWRFGVFVILFFNVLAVFNPSRRDLKNIALGLVFYVLLSLFWPVLESLNAFLIFVLIWANLILSLATFFLLGFITLRNKLKSAFFRKLTFLKKRVK